MNENNDPKDIFKKFNILSPIKQIVKYLAFFALLFVIAFSLVNGNALVQKIKYFWDTDLQNQPWTNKVAVPTTAVITESRLTIPKIAVSAPITWNVDPENVNPPLENGVAHFKGTAYPGAIGNVFIFGHSSYYVWAPGSYKDVFALLDELEQGDKIYINYQGLKYSYTVTGKITVKPDNTEVLKQGDTKMLSLMTCVPVGTNLKRLIVQASQD